MPALERFEPQLVMVSAGFDAHREDPLAHLQLEDEDYEWIIEPDRGSRRAQRAGPDRLDARRRLQHPGARPQRGAARARARRMSA